MERDVRQFFQAAKKFDGLHLGMEFMKGVQGLGYYPKQHVAISLAHDLAIPETTHHPVKLELDIVSHRR